MAERTPTEDLLVGGLDDWADAGWVVQSGRLSGKRDSAALRDLAVGMIAEVLTRGLMVAGDIVGDTHVPWECTADDAIDRIAREWIDEWGEEVPTPGAIVWLDNTSAGDELARAVLQREASS